MPKMTKDGMELGDRLPKKKKGKVVSKESIKESKDKSEVVAEADDEAEAGRRLETEWTRALWDISTKMCLMCKARRKRQESVPRSLRMLHTL